MAISFPFVLTFAATKGSEVRIAHLESLGRRACGVAAAAHFLRFRRSQPGEIFTTLALYGYEVVMELRNELK
jgi:hypothetical protein